MRADETLLLTGRLALYASALALGLAGFRCLSRALSR